MTDAAHAEQVAPRRLAAIRVTTTMPRLPADIIGQLDQIWPVLRGQGIRTGHNVVVYHGGERDGHLVIDVGVEVFDDFAGHGQIRPTDTPAGEVVTAAHFGDYAEMAPAYAAIDRCADSDRSAAGVSWEVYGDWDDNPARRRTDIYFLVASAA